MISIPCKRPILSERNEHFLFAELLQTVQWVRLQTVSYSDLQSLTELRLYEVICKVYVNTCKTLSSSSMLFIPYRARHIRGMRIVRLHGVIFSHPSPHLFLWYFILIRDIESPSSSSYCRPSPLSTVTSTAIFVISSWYKIRDWSQNIIITQNVAVVPLKHQKP